MKEKSKLFFESLKLVWQSAPGWATANTILSVVQSFIPLLLLWLLKNFIDSITLAAASGESINSVILPAGMLVLVWFTDEALSDAATYVRRKQAVKFEVHMYSLLHTKAARLDLINFEDPGYFDCLSRATSEATWRPNNILNNMVAISRGMLSLFLVAGLIFTFSWVPAILLVAANIPAVWLKLHYAEVLYDFHRSQTPEARKSAYYNWLLTGDRPSREIRLFGLGDYFRALFKESFSRQKEKELEIIRKRAIVEFVSDLFKAGAFLATLILIGAKTLDHTITLGQMAMFLVAFRQGMVYIKDLFSSLAGLYEDGLFIGDTFEFLNLREKINAIAPVSQPGTLKKNIIAENISFTYPGNSIPAINSISLEINEGEIVAIVGENGAGKSTLVRLLCRLYDPDHGVIKYDGTDIRSFEASAYREMFSAVFQDFMLYNLTAGENIRLGDLKQKEDPDKIMASAESAGIAEFIESLPGGYNCLIGNLFKESRELSWGEWQKIAIARALFRNSCVLILDEPSSSLDPDTEFDIFSRLKEIVRGRTTLLISHRLTNVSLADKIIVMSKGQIQETGSHSELMKKDGMYKSMYLKQTERFS